MLSEKLKEFKKESEKKYESFGDNDIGSRDRERERVLTDDTQLVACRRSEQLMAGWRGVIVASSADEQSSLSH